MASMAHPRERSYSRSPKELGLLSCRPLRRSSTIVFTQKASDT